MSTINFNNMGDAMGFRSKLLKHMNERNGERIKDYLTVAFNNVDPHKPETHPCFDVINKAEKLMAELGWKTGFYDWGEGKGLQYTCVSPDNRWYRSHYTY